MQKADSIMNKEIEIKIQLEPAEERLLRDYCEQYATNKECCQQIDYYLNNPQASLCFTNPAGDKDAFTYLRVRQTDQWTLLCVKQSHKIIETRTLLYANEYEVFVDDAEKTLALFKALGYTDVTTVKKVREAFAIDVFEVAFDVVEKLGTFIEIELKVEVDDHDKGRQQIYDWLQSIGINSFTQVLQGYVHMIWNPAHNFNKKITF